MKLILASGSPRRREILSALDIPFTVRTSDADEPCTITAPAGRVAAIASAKCAAVRDAMLSEGTLDDDTMILAADTLVVQDGRFLGKPADADDAARMIRALAGTTHIVSSGIAVWYRGRMVTASEITEVEFAPMTEEEIAKTRNFGKKSLSEIKDKLKEWNLELGMTDYTVLRTVIVPENKEENDEA